MRRTRLARISPKHRRELGDYSRASAEYLVEHPQCEIGPAFLAAGLRLRCLGVATHVHHTKGRGKYLCDKSTFKSSCSGECHPQAVHQTHKDVAIKIGLIV